MYNEQVKGVISCYNRKRVGKKKTYNEELVRELASKLQLSPLVVSLFLGRGLDTEDKIMDFFNTAEQEFHDPFLLEGMDRTVERVKQAIQNGEQILIFGDYDADGVSSTTVLFFSASRIRSRCGILYSKPFYGRIWTK